MMTRLEEMIRAAALAGRYRAEARGSARCRGGWLRMAEKHSARAAELAEDIEGRDERATTPQHPAHGSRHR